MTLSYAIWLLVLNSLVWFSLHVGVSMICFRISLDFFLKDSKFFEIAPWEDNGQLWHRLFLVKKWKKYLIDGSSIAKTSYNKRHLHGTKKADLTIFAAETKRAELTHWLLMIPAPLFFLWNPPWAGWVMIGYALIINIPFILTQRYNRGRIQKIIQKF